MTMLEKVAMVKLSQKPYCDVKDKLYEIIVAKHNRECDSIEFFWVGDTDILVKYKWKCCGVYTEDIVDIPIALLADDRDIQVDTKTEGVV